MPAEETDEQQITKLHEGITKFFREEHMEANKRVKSHELITMRPEVLVRDQHHKVKLIELKALAKKGPGLEACENVSDSVLSSPEFNGVFALKIMKKTEIVRLKQVDHVRNESLIHSRMSHPYLSTLFHRFSDERNLYIVQEFVQHGRMYEMIQMNSRIPNDTARFFAAQVVMAIQYLHGEHVVYRDLNPENVLIDRGMYVKLGNFGLAKVLNFDDPTARTWTLCGSAEYLAPEIITSKGHSKEVDWWALGILIHEMLAGYPPFYDKDEYKIYQQVLNAKPATDEKFFPKHFEKYGSDLVKKLLGKERTKRIGSSKNGAEDIKKHKWYRGLNWAALYNKQLELPSHELTHVPTTGSYLDVSCYPEGRKDEASSEENGPTLEADKDWAHFGNWEYIAKPEDLKGANKGRSE